MGGASEGVEGVFGEEGGEMVDGCGGWLKWDRGMGHRESEKKEWDGMDGI